MLIDTVSHGNARLTGNMLATAKNNKLLNINSHLLGTVV